jgi:hypothetical protein
MTTKSTGQKATSDDNAIRRLTVPAEIYPYRAGIIGGFLGGIGMAIVAMATVPFIGHSIWFPINLVAAAVLRNLQTPPSPETLDQFMPLALIVGLVIHLLLSTLVGTLFALLLPTMPGSAFIWSLITGPILWAIVNFVALPLVNPIMSQRVDTTSFIIAHVVYSLVLGWWVARYPKVPAG